MSSGMRVPNNVHASRPWRIHELMDGFRLEDVWQLPSAAGRREEFPRLVELVASTDPSRSSSFAVRNLFAIRWKLGALFGWDDEEGGVGSRVATLRDRLPADLRDGPTGPEFAALPFRSLYLLDDEWAAEIANQTMHGLLHLGWVPDDAGAFKAEMAVYVKPNGPMGKGYMAAIKPFRHVLVYPPMLREFDRSWQSIARQ